MPKRSSTHSEIYLHFVWTTKNRERLVDEKVEKELSKVFFAKAAELGIQIIAENGTEDHRHVLVRSNASIRPADIAKHLKGISSHFVNDVLGGTSTGDRLYWQEGYSVFSVSPAAVKSVSTYIRKQKEHHLEGATDAEQEAG